MLVRAKRGQGSIRLTFQLFFLPCMTNRAPRKMRKKCGNASAFDVISRFLDCAERELLLYGTYAYLLLFFLYN